MAIIQSCCCWRSLRKGCYASALYTLVYFIITIVTMAHFVEVERRYLSGEMAEPESASFLQPTKITHTTVTLNIILLGCSSIGFISSILMIVGVYKDMKLLLIPWILVMGLETCVEVVNTVYLFYLETLQFNPITSFLFTLDFFVRMLNIYAIICVISQFQEYQEGRGTAAFDVDERMASVQYTAAVQHTTTTSSALSSKRRISSLKPLPSFAPEPSKIDNEESSVAPPAELPPKPITSVLAKSGKATVKKHVKFPDEGSCMFELPSITIEPAEEEEKNEPSVLASLWMERESGAVPER